MAQVHGKDTFISVDGDDLSPYCNTSTLSRTGDSHDTTTYGKDDHVFSRGLGNSTGSMGGIYENGVAGPGAVLRPLVKANPVTLIRKTEGTGSGKPQESLSVLILSYVETNPVADMISWSCEFQGTDAITDTTQA